MFGWFKKKTDDAEEESGYDRRQFLRGSFIREALTPEGLDDEPGEQTEQAEASDQPQPAHQSAHQPVDLLALLSQLDPHSSDRQLPPGVDKLRSRRRGSIPVLRPPGAVAEQDFLQLCTLCGACAEACPHDSIVGAPSRFREAAGSPMIDAFNTPCHMCDDAPCIAACEPGALRDDLPKKLGLAMLQQHSCLAYNNSFCSVCAERCPEEGAIEVERGKPRIVAENCTGCGICHSVCPAPVNAIMIMPNPNRVGV
jgi:MauM/NapG family ferredoxin protein